MTKSQKKSGRRGSRVQEQFAFISVNASLVEKDRGDRIWIEFLCDPLGTFPSTRVVEVVEKGVIALVCCTELAVVLKARASMFSLFTV